MVGSRSDVYLKNANKTSVAYFGKDPLCQSNCRISYDVQVEWKVDPVGSWKEGEPSKSIMSPEMLMRP